MDGSQMANGDMIPQSIDKVVNELAAGNRNMSGLITAVTAFTESRTVDNSWAPIQCSVGGTSNTIVLTPTSATVTALVDGMLFSFVPTATTTTASVPTVQISGASSAITLKAPDGYTFALWFDVQMNMPMVVRYAAAQNVFVIQTPPLSFKSAIFGNGKVKLQADGATSISLTQEDGQALLIWNPITSAFRLVACPTITNSSLFTAVNYVEGVANQALSNNQLYAVYVFNTSGTNDQAVALDFYRMYTGVGSEAWTPVINEIGIYVKRSSIGAGTADNSRTYVGMMWTGAGSISTELNGTSLRSAVQSHYNLWQFQMLSSLVTVTGFTSASTALQSTPIATVVTEGINMTPTFVLNANYQNATSGNTGTIQLSISGTAFDGSAFAATSQTAKFTTCANNAWGQMTVNWGVAVPMGVFIVQPLLTVTGGTAVFEMDLTVVFAN